MIHKLRHLVQGMQPPQVMGEVVQQPQVAPMEGQQVIVVGQGQQYGMMHSQRPTHAMTMLDAIKTCLTRKYADFNGRASKSEYWWFTLFNFLIYCGFIGLFIVGIIVEQNNVFNGDTIFVMFILIALLFGFWMLYVIIPTLGVTARRLHDQGKSGWFILLSLIPYIGPFVIFIFLVLEGDPIPNRFGPCPTNRVD